MHRPQDLQILLAEDDDDDYLLAREAMREAELSQTVTRVCDGEQLLDALHQPDFMDACLGGLLIILDLNMPRKDGREALREIKADPLLRRIPVIVMTTSTAEDDLVNAYELGVNSFINKPLTFQGLIDTMRSIKDYWCDIATVPSLANA